jgi:hypothetical protein
LTNIKYFQIKTIQKITNKSKQNNKNITNKSKQNNRGCPLPPEAAVPAVPRSGPIIYPLWREAAQYCVTASQGSGHANFKKTCQKWCFGLSIFGKCYI